jgi:hypothetical protein
MSRALFLGRILTLAVIVAAIVSKTAAAATYTPPSTAGCSEPAASQLFSAWGDFGWYAMVPGEAPNNFAGTGWTLSGGATIKTTRLADGSSGQVLDMPSGSEAVSPLMCIGDGMPIAKTLIRYGAGTSGSVRFTPRDLTTNTTLGTMGLKTTSAWALTPPVNVLPGSISGWHIMQFTYVAGGTGSEFQLYDFGVDPRMRY